MSKSLRFPAVAPLIALACVVFIVQALHIVHGNPPGVFARDRVLSVYLRGKDLAQTSDIVNREAVVSHEAATLRGMDLILPEDSRVFIKGVIGFTNYSNRGLFYYASYYLFPREIALSLDGPAQETKDGFLGRSDASDSQIQSAGFDIIIYSLQKGMVKFTTVRTLAPEPITPRWFDSNRDRVVAFLLPLLTAFSGMWLLRLLFSQAAHSMGLLEQLACGLAFGMMAVAAVTLAIKLCGWHGHYLVFLTTATGALAEVLRNRNLYLSGIISWFSSAMRNPLRTGITLTGLMIFLLLFRVAGLTGLAEYDAVMGWALKAKMLHLYTGHELLQWFSTPRLAHAHLDYPTLVPSLHAATYDSLGHVDEFITKFWPVWLLLFLIGALASLTRGIKEGFPVRQLILLTVVLLPGTLEYVQYEGATMPIAFFTVMGFIQCAIGLGRKESNRLGLGLTFLFGAAMTKFEGLVFLGVAAGSILLFPSARASLRLPGSFGRMLFFCFLTMLPFVCLRAEIKAVNFESGWASYVFHHAGSTLARWPGIFLMMLARLFVRKDLADWVLDNGHFNWIGHWDGISSLCDHLTFGLPWACLVMTLVLWFSVPTSRSTVLWMLAMIVAVTAALSGIAAGFCNVIGIEHIIAITESGQRCSIPLFESSDRYFLPVLLAWLAVLITLLFADERIPASSASIERQALVPKPTAAH